MYLSSFRRKLRSKLQEKVYSPARGALKDFIHQQVRLAVREEIHFQLKTIDFGLNLRSILDSADFVLDNIPLHLRFHHKELRRMAIEAAPREGLFFEFGVANGFWINQIAEYAGTTVYGFDSFQGLPEPWSFLPRGSFRVDKLPQCHPNVKLIPGWFENTLPEFLKGHPGKVGFIHMDCDLYSSTMTVLNLLKDRFVPGSVIVLDDFLCEPGWRKQEHKAFLDFIRESAFEFKYLGYTIDYPAASVVIQFTRTSCQNSHCDGR